MAIDHHTINHIANLARIHVDDAEIERYTSELSRILDLVEQMNAVDTDDVEPLTHPQDRRLRMREDVVTEHDQRADYQTIAPAVESGLYLVPKVIE